MAGNGGFLRKRKGKKVWRKIYIDVCIHTLTYVTYVHTCYVCGYVYIYIHMNIDIDMVTCIFPVLITSDRQPSLFSPGWGLRVNNAE